MQMLPPLLSSEIRSPSSWTVASIKKQQVHFHSFSIPTNSAFGVTLHRNAFKKFLNHLSYYKSAMCSVPILAGVGILFFITLKQSYSEIFQISSWGKKESKMSKLDSLLPVSGSGKQPEVSFM